ncbi:MAG: oxidoreductase [Pseudomonadota bacterium]
MGRKPKIALYWCSSCGGCEESVIDLAEGLLELADVVDIVFWPVATDYKYRDLVELNDKEIRAAFINGAIRLDDHVETSRILRRKSELVFAHGTCAHLGGVVGLGNFHSRDDLLNRAYREAPTVRNPREKLPKVKTKDSGRELNLPGMKQDVRSLDQVVEVDYYIPGCPPPPELIRKAMGMLLGDRLPPKGSVLAEKKALCDTCPRKDSRPESLKILRFKRLYEVDWDPFTCFLGQGIICLGPATRGGCSASCINGNMPCRGCFGPTDKVMDQGAKSLSFLASLIDSKDERELEEIADSIPDPAGLFYRYSLASSLLRGKLKGQSG